MSQQEEEQQHFPCLDQSAAPQIKREGRWLPGLLVRRASRQRVTKGGGEAKKKERIYTTSQDLPNIATDLFAPLRV